MKIVKIHDKQVKDEYFKQRGKFINAEAAIKAGISEFDQSLSEEDIREYYRDLLKSYLEEGRRFRIADRWLLKWLGIEKYEAIENDTVIVEGYDEYKAARSGL